MLRSGSRLMNIPNNSFNLRNIEVKNLFDRDYEEGAFGNIRQRENFS